MSRAMSTMGMRFRRTMRTGKPATRPPARTPRGMVTIPARNALGQGRPVSGVQNAQSNRMVKTTVAAQHGSPPADRPACRLGLPASSCARGAPPMSLARMVPANMAGSAPRIRYTGTTTGRRRLASTGARLMIPTIDRPESPEPGCRFRTPAPGRSGCRRFGPARLKRQTRP